MFSRAHVLIVAGPSGAGKTTFIERLAHGHLPPAIANRLPDGAEDWPRFAIEELPGLGGAARERQEPVGAIIHLDMTAVCYFRPRACANTLPKIRNAPAITILELSGVPDQITWRYLQREWQRRDASKADPALPKGAVLSHFALPKTGSAADKGVTVELARRAGLDSRAAQKLALYRQEGWLDMLRKVWRRQLATHLPGKEVTFVEVELIDGRRAGDLGVFRLVAARKHTL